MKPETTPPPKKWPVEPVPWPAGRNPVGAEKKVILGFIEDNLIALLDYYGLEGGFDNPHNGWLLAMRLADDIIPGFAPEPPPPPPKPAHRPHDLRAGARDLLLCLELTNAKLRGKSVREAANNLAERWKKEGKCSWSGAALRSRYYRLSSQIRKTGEAPTGMTEAARILSGSTK